MSLENFQMLGGTTIGTSFIRRNSVKIYHQQGAQSINSNHGNGFIIIANNIYHQIGNAYLEFDVTLRIYRTAFNNPIGDGNKYDPFTSVKMVLLMHSG